MNQLATKPETQVSTAGNMISIIEKAIENPNVNVEKMQQLLDVQERIMNKNAEMAFNQAMVNAQAEMPIIKNDATNNQTRSSYVKFETMQSKVIPVASKNGFSISYDTGEVINIGEAPAMWIYAVVNHIDGHSKQFQYLSPLTHLGAQGKAVMTLQHACRSAISYGERTLLKMIFNLIETDADDDGNMAGDGTIGENQISELNILMDKTGHDNALDRVLSYATRLNGSEVKSLDEIRQSMFLQVKNVLVSQIDNAKKDKSDK